MSVRRTDHTARKVNARLDLAVPLMPVERRVLSKDLCSSATICWAGFQGPFLFSFFRQQCSKIVVVRSARLGGRSIERQHALRPERSRSG